MTKSTLDKLDTARVEVKKLEAKLRLEMDLLAKRERIYCMNEIIYRRMSGGK